MKKLSLLGLSLEDYIEKAKDSSSLPGGGSACALAGALAGSLTLMAGRLSNIEDWPYDRLEDAIERLKENIDIDGQAFDGVLEARRLPQKTQEEAQVRDKALEKAYLHAISVPMETAAQALNVLAGLNNMQEDLDFKRVQADAAIARDLGFLAFEGAIKTAIGNLEGIKDPVVRTGEDMKIQVLLEKRSQLQNLLAKL